MCRKRRLELLGVWRVNVIPVVCIDALTFHVSVGQIDRNICAGRAAFLSDDDCGQRRKSVVDAIERNVAEDFVKNALCLPAVHQEGEALVCECLSVHCGTDKHQPGLKGAVGVIRRWVER